MNVRTVLLTLGCIGLSTGAIALLAQTPSFAQSAPDTNDFSLQVTPSPLVMTIKPGQNSTMELRIRNAGSSTERLKIEPKSFSLNDESEQIELKDDTAPSVSEWLSFSDPRFTIEPGQWFTQEITVAVPKDAGFSYSFVLQISRQNETSPRDGERQLRGSLAVFTLINIDRPDAKSEISVASIETDKKVYEFLPASFNIRLKNSGNTILRPSGNIFVQRSSDDQNPIATLQVNEARSYILPGTTRTLASSWSDGFPYYAATKDANGTVSSDLTWNWKNAEKLRFGRYTAKLVAIYSDGRRDVPIEAEVTFWVIPYKSILALLVIVTTVGAGVWWLIRRHTQNAVNKALKK